MSRAGLGPMPFCPRRRQSSFRHRHGTTNEAGILDSDSAAAPSLGERRIWGKSLEVGGRDDNAPYAIVAVPRPSGQVFLCGFVLLFFSDTPSVFGYAVGRGEGLLAPSTAKVLFTPSLGLACWAETWLATMPVRYRRVGLVGLRFWLGYIVFSGCMPAREKGTGRSFFGVGFAGFGRADGIESIPSSECSV